MRKKMKDETEKVVNTLPKFTRQQLLQSERYSYKKDIVHALLQEDSVYTLEKTDQLIDEFMKGKVN